MSEAESITDIIDVQGRTLECADLTKKRMKIGENALCALMKYTDFPGAVPIGRVRYFDPRAVDQWVLGYNKDRGN